MSDKKKTSIADETDMMEINTEASQEDEKGFGAWVKRHKNQLILVGISIPTIIAVIAGLKNKDAIKELWDELIEEINKVDMYSSKWFEIATDEELRTERENIRLAYCSSGDDFSETNRLEKLLNRFDKEMSKRAWGDEIPHGPGIHREHGYYLPNDD